jgi:hypothetical protein
MRALLVVEFRRVKRTRMVVRVSAEVVDIVD